MPVVQTSKVLAAVAGKIKDFDAAKNSKPQVRRRMPPGVRGIAQVTGVRSEEDDKGRPRISIASMVLTPEEFNGETLDGCPFWINVPMYESTYEGRTTTIQDRIVRLFETVQLLGEDVSECEDISDLDAILADIGKGKPYFKFSSYKSRGSDYVNVGIDGPSDAPEGADDSQEAVEYVEDDGSDPEPTSYGQAADDGDEEAVNILNEQCEAAEIDPNEYATWVEVEELLNAQADEGPELDTSETQVEPEPEKPKKKTRTRKPKVAKTVTEVPTYGSMYGCDVEGDGTMHSCEVTSIDEDAKTVTITSYDNDYEYEDISWDDLGPDPRAS